MLCGFGNLLGRCAPNEISVVSFFLLAQPELVIDLEAAATNNWYALMRPVHAREVS